MHRRLTLITRRSAALASLLSLVAMVAASGPLSGCGGGPGRPAGAALPRWEGDLRFLFDDQVHPAAVRLSLDGQSPAEDRMLPFRAQAADLVSRMRVQTVSRPAVGAKMSYELILQVGVPTLMPTEVEDRTFGLTFDQNNPSFGLVQSIEPRLGGHTFIGFIKRFAGPEGPEVHFHLTADTAEVAQVIGELAMLQEIAGK